MWTMAQLILESTISMHSTLMSFSSRNCTLHFNCYITFGSGDQIGLCDWWADCCKLRQYRTGHIIIICQLIHFNWEQRWNSTRKGNFSRYNTGKVMLRNILLPNYTRRGLSDEKCFCLVLLFNPCSVFLSSASSTRSSLILFITSYPFQSVGGKRYPTRHVNSQKIR